MLQCGSEMESRHDDVRLPHHEQESSMIQELDRVVLQTDIPAYRLQAGDVGTVVMVHRGARLYRRVSDTGRRDGSCRDARRRAGACHQAKRDHTCSRARVSLSGVSALHYPG